MLTSTSNSISFWIVWPPLPPPHHPQNHHHHPRPFPPQTTHETWSFAFRWPRSFWLDLQNHIILQLPRYSRCRALHHRVVLYGRTRVSMDVEEWVPYVVDRHALSLRVMIFSILLRWPLRRPLQTIIVGHRERLFDGVRAPRKPGRWTRYAVPVELFRIRPHPWTLLWGAGFAADVLASGRGSGQTSRGQVAWPPP